jgi:hypothetical protein
MRLDAVEVRSSQSEGRKFDEKTTQQILLTPARRAALDALERDFKELLTAARISGAV